MEAYRLDMTQSERRSQLKAQIAVELEKTDRARRRDDWGTVRLHKETISKLKNTLRLLPKIYALRTEREGNHDRTKVRKQSTG